MSGDQWVKTEFDRMMVKLAKDATLRVHINHDNRWIPATLISWRASRVRVRFAHGTSASVRRDRVRLPDDLADMQAGAS